MGDALVGDALVGDVLVGDALVGEVVVGAVGDALVGLSEGTADAWQPPVPRGEPRPTHFNG